MDDLARAYYELKFEVEFLRKKGTEFQHFFEDIMEKAHPADFIRVRPWGNIGDRKNDGYLRSERTLFQSYAPMEMSAAEAVAKIDEDFLGALPHWKQFFDVWAFVHNCRDGLGPDVTSKLLEMSAAHAPLRAVPWGFEEIRRRLFTINDADIAALLGPAPTRSDMGKVTVAKLETVLRAIARQPATPDQEIQPVPPKKLETNGLSEHVKVMLKAGMAKTNLVRKFFRGCADPTLGDEIVRAFNSKYLELRGTVMDADAIFRDLQIFAGGSQGGLPEYEASVLAVLAYLFEECDIFERPVLEERA